MELPIGIRDVGFVDGLGYNYKRGREPDKFGQYSHTGQRCQYY